MLGCAGLAWPSSSNNQPSLLHGQLVHKLTACCMKVSCSMFALEHPAQLCAGMRSRPSVLAVSPAPGSNCQDVHSSCAAMQFVTCH